VGNAHRRYGQRRPPGGARGGRGGGGWGGDAAIRFGGHAAIDHPLAISSRASDRPELTSQGTRILAMAAGSGVSGEQDQLSAWRARPSSRPRCRPLMFVRLTWGLAATLEIHWGCPFLQQGKGENVGLTAAHPPPAVGAPPRPSLRPAAITCHRDPRPARGRLKPLTNLLVDPATKHHSRPHHRLGIVTRRPSRTGLDRHPAQPLG